MQISDIPIIWVETGRRVPKYARANFRQTAKLFPQLTQYLVTDSKQNCAKVHKIHLEEADKSHLTLQFERLGKNWNRRQEYFWQGTTSRFFYLYDAMVKLDTETALHLETDSVLLNFEAMAYVFSIDGIELAYPMQSDVLGCGSIVIVRNKGMLESFLKYILENWQDADANDMSLLGNFSSNKKVLKLPTWINQDSDNANVIFDAGSIGKFYLGTDARNVRWPLSIRGTGDNSPGAVTKYFTDKQIQWKVKKERRKLSISLFQANREWELVNIHIHSKRIKSMIWMNFLAFKIGFGFSTNNLFRYGLIDYRVLMERAISFFARRIAREQKNRDVNLR